MFTQECPYCPRKITTYMGEPAARALMDEHILDEHPAKYVSTRSFTDELTIEDSRFLRKCGIAPYL